MQSLFLIASAVSGSTVKGAEGFLHVIAVGAAGFGFGRGKPAVTVFDNEQGFVKHHMIRECENNPMACDISSMA